jgi:branched-chain amino acid aminotransferase
LPNHFIQANTNGRLHDASLPSLPPLNRGFLYGDAVYEVWRTYQGVLFAWEEHLERLRRSAEALHLPLPLAPGGLLAEIRRTTDAFRGASGHAGELYIRVQITRGGGPIGLDTALADRPDYVILVQPCPETSPEKARSGLRLSIAVGLRRNPVDALNPAWKTGNYLNNILCLREARARGADEVVMLNHAGEVTEAAVSNIAFVRDGTLVMPPLSAGILGGITRGLLVSRIARSSGVDVREETVRPAALPTMQECMLLSTTKDVTPVAAIDGFSFGVGPDTVTARLKAAFGEFVRAHTVANPGLKL